MCEVCEQSFPFSILIDRGGFGDSFDCVEGSSSDNIQEIIFLYDGLMCNDASVCGGKMELKYW